MMKNNDPSDGLTLAGERRIAGAIQDFWTQKGYSGFEATIVPINVKGGIAVYCVRSNIGPKGFPPKAAIPVND